MAMPAIPHNVIPQSVYSDHRLDRPSEQIRLLKVLDPSTTQPGQARFACELLVVSLRDTHTHTFWALSYTWRNALYPDPRESSRTEGSAVIICNKTKCRILENLYEALISLGPRAREADQYLWVDAICIDQKNAEEKTLQVQLMGEIYQAATRVCIWLGKSDESTKDAIELIASLQLVESHELAGISLSTLSDPIVSNILEDKYNHRRYWVSLARFLRRTWFTRAWVVQEVILANPEELRVHCGEHDIAWEALKEISDYLCRSSWKETFASRAFLEDELLPPRVSAAAKIGGTQADIIKMTNATYSGEPHDLFLDTLIRVREFDCGSRRDKAYCCFGIGMRFRPRGFPFPKPDYSSSTTDAEAFTRTARAVLQMSQSLHLLAYAESLRTADLQGKDKMPSWVPDWSVSEKVGLGITGYRRYRAAANMMQTVEFADQPENNILRLRAARVGEVKIVGNSKSEISRGCELSATESVLECIRKDYKVGVPSIRQSREEVLWRTLIHDTCPGGQCPACRQAATTMATWKEWGCW